MRYTTVIDISEMPDIYKNQHARVLYLHLALKSGYHDSDRDRIKISIRILAGTVGLTVSAVRHALQQLEKAGLVKRDGDTMVIKKWIIDEPPTPRQKKMDPKSSDGRTKQEIGRQFDEQIEEYKQKVYNAVRQMTRDELQAWLDELKAGRSIRHYGAQLAANQTNIQWLTNQIEKQ